MQGGLQTPYAPLRWRRRRRRGKFLLVFRLYQRSERSDESFSAAVSCRSSRFELRDLSVFNDRGQACR